MSLPPTCLIHFASPFSFPFLQHLNVMLYLHGKEGEQLVGMGTQNIEGVMSGEREGAGTGKEIYVVPLVDKTGKHCGDVSTTMRFFPTRSPGGQRLYELPECSTPHRFPNLWCMSFSAT